jgi:hypothetical protein
MFCLRQKSLKINIYELEVTKEASTQNETLDLHEKNSTQVKQIFWKIYDDLGKRPLMVQHQSPMIMANKRMQLQVLDVGC